MSNQQLPPDFAGFRDLHEGDSVVVCGCGSSLHQLPNPERLTTIGVNDVGRLFSPTYLVVLNPKNQFRDDRFSFVESSTASAVFSQLPLKLRSSRLVPFRLGRRGGADVWQTPGALPYTRNSPYVAVCLAAYMGAKRIGLVGVDFTEDHFFAKTGRHALTASLSAIDREYGKLRSALAEKGVDLVNLSGVSQLSTLPKVDVSAFSANALEAHPVSVTPKERGADTSTAAEPSLSIVSYATTPVAGVPPILARCIERETPHRARCVWARSDYGNGVKFQGDIEWKSKGGEAQAALAAADLVVVHNGKVEPAHRSLLAGKPTVVMAHNYGWNVDMSLAQAGAGRVVVGQYQATLPEFQDWGTVPNPIPYWEPEFSPAAKGKRIRICYTPSGRHEKYAPGHRLYWHSKGYETTMRVLKALAQRWPIDLEVIGSRQISHAESLAMKRRSHIVIDECVTGSYHRNSLEGLAAGCVVVNGLGLCPEIADAFRRCVPGSATIPFVEASLESLETRLEELLEMGEPALLERGRENREWLTGHWDFRQQWEHHWRPEVERALSQKPSRVRRSRPTPAKLSTDAVVRVARSESRVRVVRPRVSGGPHAAADQAPRAVSVVIPHGSKARLPLLERTLLNLQECEGVVDVVVVELDKEPHAEEIARKLATAYLYRHHVGTFHKPLAMNLGVGLTSCRRFLWHDNDILIPKDFVPQALAEMERRRLDCLVPWTSVRYLSEQDSQEVLLGAAPGAHHRPVTTFHSRRGVCGGAVLAKRDFFDRFGGVPEEFCGWGGEDSAWICKVQRLGRAGVTTRRDAHLHHLYHPLSGGYAKGEHIAANPHYQKNFELLMRARATRTGESFLVHFPRPSRSRLPWSAERRVKVFATAARRDLALEICKEFERSFGLGLPMVVGTPGAADRQCLDAAIVIGTRLAMECASEASNAALMRRAVIAHDCLVGTEAPLSMTLAHLGIDRRIERALENTSLRTWSGLRADRGTPLGRRAVIKLIQPLSVILGIVDSESCSKPGPDSMELRNAG